RANGHAVHHHAAIHHAAGHHGAEILHHGAGRLVVADAGDLHAAVAFFHLHGAARNHEPLRARRHGHRHRSHTIAHRGHAHPCSFHHHVGHRVTLLMRTVLEPIQRLTTANMIVNFPQLPQVLISKKSTKVKYSTKSPATRQRAPTWHGFCRLIHFARS